MDNATALPQATSHTRDPLTVAVVDVIYTGDLPTLERLLEQSPGLALVRPGDDDPDAMSRTLRHVATDWPGHRPTPATIV